MNEEHSGIPNQNNISESEAIIGCFVYELDDKAARHFQ